MFFREDVCPILFQYFKKKFFHLNANDIIRDARSRHKALFLQYNQTKIYEELSLHKIFVDLKNFDHYLPKVYTWVVQNYNTQNRLHSNEVLGFIGVNHNVNIQSLINFTPEHKHVKFLYKNFCKFDNTVGH